MIDKLKKDVRNLANPQKAKVYRRFFKTGIGEYGGGSRTMLRYAIERFPEGLRKRYLL